MNEHEPKKRIHLTDESGVTRRDVLRRGAIVGGTLLWVAPAIQSMAPKALAAVQGPSPGGCAACICFNVAGTVGESLIDAAVSGPAGVGPTHPLFSSDNCENWCKHQDQFAVTGGVGSGPYANSQYCHGATANDCEGNSTHVSCDGGVTFIPV
jgi:hypothetical protein